MLTSSMLATGGQPPVLYGPAPAISACTSAVSNNGQCFNHNLIANASVLVSWTVTPSGAAPGYTLQVYNSGTLIASGLSCATTSYTQSFSSPVKLTGTSFNYTYSVEVVRGDGTVMSTATASVLTVILGTC